MSAYDHRALRALQDYEYEAALLHDRRRAAQRELCEGYASDAGVRVAVHFDESEERPWLVTLQREAPLSVLLPLFAASNGLQVLRPADRLTGVESCVVAKLVHGSRRSVPKLSELARGCRAPLQVRSFDGCTGKRGKLYMVLSDLDTSDSDQQQDEDAFDARELRRHRARLPIKV